MKKFTKQPPRFYLREGLLMVEIAPNQAVRAAIAMERGLVTVEEVNAAHARLNAETVQ